MALPISPTPLLDSEQAKVFFQKVWEDLKRPATYKSTPKLENARKLVQEYATKRAK